MTSGSDEIDVFDGKIRILAVETNETEVAVKWLVSPEPDFKMAIPGYYEALEEAFPRAASDDDPRTGLRMLLEMRAYQFELTDDVGTTYVHEGGGSDLKDAGRIGIERFSPAPPLVASGATLWWLGHEIPVQLS